MCHDAKETETAGLAAGIIPPNRPGGSLQSGACQGLANTRKWDVPIKLKPLPALPATPGEL